MKKIMTFVVFLFVSNMLTALPQFGFIPFDMGIGISNNKEISMDFNIKFLYLSNELEIHKDRYINTGLGLTWVPVNYKYIAHNHYWSFINFQIFWNIFALIHDKTPYDVEPGGMFVNGAIFGPFAFINYGQNFNFNNYILIYGIKYNLTGIMESNRLYIFNIEGGCRIIDGKNSVYINLGIDIIWTSLFAIINIQEKEKKE